jgi:YVTN family beta-propeller protein
MAVDDTSVWVTSNSTTELDRIDPVTNTVVERITIDRGGCGIAVGPDGRIWVAELGIGSVVAVDPATAAITGRIDGIGPQLWDLKAGFDSIWIADRSAKAVLRIDPETDKVIATIAVGPQPSGLAVMAAGVWVSDDIDGKVRRIDPATNTVVATIDVGGAPSWFADDGGSTLVVAQRVTGQVVSLDATTGALGTAVAGWKGPLDGTVLNGTAWIPEGSRGSVGVLDLAEAGTGAEARATHYALPGAFNPFVAEPAFGDIWVLDFGATTIWRIRP